MANKVGAADAAAFLARFDGDVEAAVQALRTQAAAAARVARPGRMVSDAIVISVQDLVKEYKIGRQKVRAISGVTADIHEGEFVAITAPSGGGKSTLLQLMGGLDKPTGGTVLVDGVDVNRLPDHKLAQFRGQTIGFVFQFFYLQPFLSLERNMEVPGMFARTERRARRERVCELAATVGLSDRLQHRPNELSGGQIQRAAIVRALLNNPKVILADEPTGNLDSKNGEAIIDLFEQIRDTLGTTIVVATHDPAVANQADRVITLKDGAIV